MPMQELCVGHLIADPKSTVKADTVVNGSALCASCVTSPEVMHPSGRVRPFRRGPGGTRVR